MTPMLLDEALRQGFLADFTQYLNTERELGCPMQLREKAQTLGLELMVRFKRKGPGAR